MTFEREEAIRINNQVHEEEQRKLRDQLTDSFVARESEQQEVGVTVQQLETELARVQELLQAAEDESVQKSRMLE